MSFTRPLIAVVGSLHYDIMLRAPHLPRLGETLAGSQWWWKPGGKGGNQAMAAARHGGLVHIIGAVGPDDFATRLRQSLQDAGVRHEHVQTVDRGSGMSVATVEAAGDYAAVIVSGANLAIDDAQIASSADLLGRAQVLILQNEINESANLSAARIVRQAGGRVIYNAAPARQPAQALTDLVDVLVVNAIEAEMLGGGVVKDLASASEAARHLQTMAPCIVVTAGSQGVAFSQPGYSSTLPAHQVAHAETHGAGDCFVGALAARIADGEDFASALSYANAAAALHVGSTETARARIGSAAVREFMTRLAKS